MSGEDPGAGRKTPVDGARKAVAAVGPLPPPVAPPKLSPAPAKLPPPVAPPKPVIATPRPSAGNNPFLDEAGSSATPRAKKPKPPPNIISAGGVDMARAHASNIQQPKAQPESRAPEGPKVVVAVETDPRRVRTGPRLAHSGHPPDSNRAVEKTLESARPPPIADGGPSPWAAVQPEVVDKKALPSANLPIPAPEPPPEKRKKGSPLWLRLSAVATLLLLAFAIVRRFWLMPSGHEASFGPVSTSVGVAPPLPDEPSAAVSAVAVAETSAVVVPAPPVVAAVAPAAATDSAAAPEPSADPVASAIADTAGEPIPAAPRPRTTAPAPPKPTYKPLFELPQEKSKE